MFALQLLMATQSLCGSPPSCTFPHCRFIDSFPTPGSWTSAQLFPCAAGSVNQTAALKPAPAGSGSPGDVLLVLKGKCLGVSFDSFGQDGQLLKAGGCDAESLQQTSLWRRNLTDATIRSAAFPHVCLHATAARPMAAVMQKVRFLLQWFLLLRHLLRFLL